jgi:hypothetical protein
MVDTPPNDPEPSLLYETKRRRIKQTVINFWRFLKSHLKEILDSKNLDFVKHNVSKIVSIAKDFKL